MNRKAIILSQGHEINLPLFYPSISTVKTNYKPIDYLKVIRTSGSTNFLISSYDIQYSNDKSELIELLLQSKSEGLNILMDSGNYEAYWYKNQDWSIEMYNEIIKLNLANIYFSFDHQQIGRMTTDEISSVAIQYSALSMANTDALVIPIIHSSPNDAAKISLEVCKGLESNHITLAERNLGNGIVERVHNMRKIRKQLNLHSEYITVHLLGTGSPFAILLLLWAGADTFDGLEWCQTSINPKTFQTYHFQLREMFDSKKEINNYNIQTLLINLDFFNQFNIEIQKSMEQNTLDKLLKKYFSQDFLKIIGCL